MTPPLAGILPIPEGVRALIWDMDGVLLDTLGADYAFAVEAAEAVTGEASWISREAVRAHFALESVSFWAKLAEAAPAPIAPHALARMVAHYEALRAAGRFPVLPGVLELIAAARARGLRLAVASSNPNDTLRAMLERAELWPLFDAVSGLGGAGVRPKPAPDLYLQAAEMLGLAPAQCLFIEDSPTGLQAGKAAGMGFAVGVATSAWSFATLHNLGLADLVYERFEAPRLTLAPGRPAEKRLGTPNDFVSHMVEHIGWRLGAGVDLLWPSSDWRGLGRLIGARVRELGLAGESAATLGMIDDGAAEVMIDRADAPGLTFETHPSLPRDKVLAMRVEQLSAGGDLLSMLEGLAEGLPARLVVRLCTFEDPHHSWEGVFRAVGICLARLRMAP